MIALIVKSLASNRLLAIIAGAALLLFAFFVWDYFDDKAVIKQDRLESNVKVLEASDAAAIEADRAAADQAAITRREQAETKGALENAVKNNPEAVKRPAGPATNAVADSLRRRANRGD